MIVTYEYRGFEYMHDSFHNSPYCLLFDKKPLIEFEQYDLLTNFVDEVLIVIETVPVFKDFKLHLTGCKRCARTANGDKLDPCQTGKQKFINAKNVSIHVCNTLVDVLTEARKAAQLEKTTAASVE